MKFETIFECKQKTCLDKTSVYIYSERSLSLSLYIYIYININI